MDIIPESKLHCLMKLYDVTGRELAKALHVDYSLVSKWKNGKRALQPRSMHVALLTEYFLKLDALSVKKKVQTVLTKAYPELELTSVNIPILLSQWLSEPYRLTDSIDESSPCINYIDAQNSMYNGSFDVYRGKSGRRTAVLRFLDLAISMPEGQDLLLISQEDMTWLVEDKQFLAGWKSKLLEIVLKKHRITIIHTVDRSFHELAVALQQWLPLHMSGSIDTWYFPQYPDTILKNTLFIIRGSAAIYGSEANSIADEMYTAFYRDAATIAIHESNYVQLLSKCIPLLEKYPLKSPHQLFEKILTAARNMDNSFFFSILPMAATIPEDLLREIFETNRLPAEKASYCTGMLRHASACFRQSSKKYYCRHIYNYDALRQAAGMNRISYSELTILAGTEIFLTGGQFARHLESLISLMNENPEFEIGLISNQNNELTDTVTTWVKENHAVMSAAQAPSTFSVYAASASEPTVVNAFYQFYANIWNSIPRIYRSKEWITEALHKIISMLKE